MRSEEFAAARGARLERSDAELLPIVRKALGNYSTKRDWYEDIVEAGEVLWRELFEESTGNADPSTEDALMEQFANTARTVLAKTADPAGAASNQAQTIAFWLSTFAANSAEQRAQRFNGHPQLKWLTREDSHVRDLHAAVDGQTIQSGSTFTLPGNVHLAFPGDPVGPLEYWINCRCLVQRVGEGVSMAGNRTAFIETDQEALVAAPVATKQPKLAGPANDLSVDDPETLTDSPIEQSDLVDTPQPTPFHGVAAPTNTPSGDGRQLAAGGFSHRNLPLPFNYQKGSFHGGDPGPAVTVGRIDAIWLDDTTGLVNYAGEFSPNIPEAAEAIQHIVDGTMTGVSVDVDNAEIQPVDPDDLDDEDLLDLMMGGGTTIFSGWRIMGVTQVALPAFQEAHVALGPHPELAAVATNPAEASESGDTDDFADTSDSGRKKSADKGHALPDGSYPIETVQDLKNAIQAIGRAKDPAKAKAHIKKRARELDHPELIPDGWSALSETFGITSNPGTHDGPGWITDPVPTGRIRRYWTEGKGRAKIAWGVDGDFDRCRSHLGKYVEPQYLAGTCANMHKEATGAWPGHAPGETRAVRASLVAAGARMAKAVNLVAEAAPMLPSEWFADPALPGPTPFTVSEEGRVFGHVATWGTCHIGYQGVCTTPPESPSQYAYYRTGAVHTEAGEVAVGHITMDGSHAPIRAGARAAASHYDNTGSVVADVAAGEDPYGIWVAGALRPGLSGERIAALKAASLSGDWRSIGGHLEMVAALAVNVPGFPIPRTSLAASGEHQESLVAAGIVTKETEMADKPVPPKPPAHDPQTDAENVPAKKAAAPPPAQHQDGPPPTEKPQGPGDEAVNSAVQTIDAELKEVLAAIEKDPQVAAEKGAELSVTVADLMKYLGLDKPEPKAEPEPEPAVTAAGVAAMVRREVAVGPRRDAARASLRAARVARAKRFVS